MARTPAQRGPFGRWLTRVRTERYDRQVDALAAMRKLAGLHISQAEYSQWESGSRVPRDDNPKVARLYEFFGSAPETGSEGTDTPDALVQALRDQTAAIGELVAALRDLALLGLGSRRGRRDASPDEVEERVAWMEQQIRERPESEVGQEQSARPERVG